MLIPDYFSMIERAVKDQYALINEARKKGIDPVHSVEIPLATSLAERTTGLISTLYPQIGDKKIVDRILDLEREYGSLDPAVALTIAEEIARERYCTFKDHVEAMEAGARIAIAYLTLGVVSSPIEGFVQLHFNKTRDGKDYFVPFFAGPIRSAGGTEAAFSLVIIDYLRELFGYAPYDPTEDEVKRGVHESYMYHDWVTNLQYLPSEKEIDFLMRHVPLQVSGDPSEDREVFNYKDLPRIPTNAIRSGFCLTMNEGLAQKAPKILKRVTKLREKGFALSGWLWLDDFVSLQKKIKESKKVGSEASATYMKDLVAGRPVFGHPSYSGGFRLRYGRCRNTGYSTLAIHPASMRISGDFIAVGTQLKIEKPTKGCTVAACSSIGGPIVKLYDGSVVAVKNSEQAKKLYSSVEEIIYFGDLLVPYGDYANRNHALDVPGYVEQHWLMEVEEKGGKSVLFPSFSEAVGLSTSLGVPLHPSYCFYWSQLSYDSLLGLVDWVSHGSVREGVVVLPYTKQDVERFSVGKRALEIVGCPHSHAIESIVLSKDDSEHFLFNLGIRQEVWEASLERSCLVVKEHSTESVLSVISLLSGVSVKDIAGTFIGSRMGRPEKAKLRKLTGSPHVLFSVGEEGGRLRSVQAAISVGSVKGEFPLYYCSLCKQYCVYPSCILCGTICVKRRWCEACLKEYDGDCPDHGPLPAFKKQRVDIGAYFDQAKKVTGLTGDMLPAAVKGVRGTSNRDHSCEHLAKGLLRAQYDLHVNKDGTIRYDMSEMPLTHFKPSELGSSVEKLRELGYEFDKDGTRLERDDQIVALFPHDIVLPASPETLDERADSVFLHISQFVDDELEKLYGMKRYFNATKKEDLLGALVGCIAPHNCAAVVGRIIGFSKTQALLASPYIHAAMRRDCDGDEAAVMLLMDMLLNFSRHFLPSHRGGTQDAPLVLNARLRAGEVDDMIFDVDVHTSLPLAFYRAAEQEKMPSDIKLEQVRNRLGGDREFVDLGYMYETDDINEGPMCSSYKTLPTMHDKVEKMMILCRKIRAVDVQDVARLVIERHFIRDTRGNLRKFSMQVFRCVGCNEKYRRPPLTGKCTRCGGKLIFTISEGSVLKYMQPAMNLALEFSVSPYLLENLELNQMYIESIFGREKEKQEALQKWFG